MVRLFWVTENRHFECISVKLSVDFVVGDHIYWWKWIIFHIQGNHQASTEGLILWDS